MDGIGESGNVGRWRRVTLPFGRERRMHARAYDHWIALLAGRRMPLLAEVDPACLGPFAGNSVLIDLSGPGPGPDPRLAFLGAALGEQAGAGGWRPGAGEVPKESLLAELMRHVPEIVAHRAPIGFEAEFAGGAGGPLLHRGILLPFADRDGRLAAILGVISWKRMAALDGLPDVVAAVEGALATRPGAPGASPWAVDPLAAAISALPPRPLAERLAAARTWAAIAATDHSGAGRAHLGLLGAAFDLLLAGMADRDGFARLAGDAPAPHPEAVVKLLLGRTAATSERITFAAVLRHALNLGVGAGQLADLLDRYEGGHAAFAAAGQHAASPAPDRGRSPRPFALMPVDASFLARIGHRPPASPEAEAAPPIVRRAVG